MKKILNPLHAHIESLQSEIKRLRNKIALLETNIKELTIENERLLKDHNSKVILGLMKPKP